MLAMSGQGKTRGTSAILMVPSACSQSVAAILPTVEALPETIHFALVNLYEDVRRITGDNERTGLNLKIIQKIEIPLPPLAEQQRIAKILNEQMAAIEKARTAAEARLGATKALTAAYLREVFPQPGQEIPKDWKWALLSEISEINPPRPSGLKRAPDALTSFVPMSAVDALSGAILNPETRIFSEVTKGYTFFAEKDILFAKITPCMQNGKHALAKGLIDNIGFGSTEFHVLRPHDGVIPEWIHYFVRQPHILSDAANHFTGAVGQQRVPEQFLAALEIPVPHINEQERIVALFNKKITMIEKVRIAVETELETINILSGALLRQAFSGGL
jgi:restriction endonuclease S subunit